MCTQKTEENSSKRRPFAYFNNHKNQKLAHKIEKEPSKTIWSYLSLNYSKKITIFLAVLILYIPLQIDATIKYNIITQTANEIKTTAKNIENSMNANSTDQKTKEYTPNSTHIDINLNKIAIASKSQNYKTKKVWVTAYSSSPDETDDTPFITASGKFAQDGFAATNMLPFGTKIKIPELYGDKIFIIEDRMHERKQNVVDIWMPSKEKAILFGSHYTDIIIINEENNLVELNLLSLNLN